MPSTQSTRKQKDNVHKWCPLHVPFPFQVFCLTLVKYWAALSPQGVRISLSVFSVCKVWTCNFASIVWPMLLSQRRGVECIYLCTSSSRGCNMVQFPAICGCSLTAGYQQLQREKWCPAISCWLLGCGGYGIQACEKQPSTTGLRLWFVDLYAGFRVSLSWKSGPWSPKTKFEMCLNICVYFSPSNDAKLTLKPIFGTNVTS